jgi:hypothetical protein
MSDLDPHSKLKNVFATLDITGANFFMVPKNDQNNLVSAILEAIPESRDVYFGFNPNAIPIEVKKSQFDSLLVELIKNRLTGLNPLTDSQARALFENIIDVTESKDAVRFWHNQKMPVDAKNEQACIEELFIIEGKENYKMLYFWEDV